MRATLALFIAGLTTGCLHITSASKSEEKVTDSTTTTVKLPTRYEVNASANGLDLLFTASKAEPCRDEVTESVSVIETVEKRLPPTHWAILGGGVAALAGGIAAAVAGSSMMAAAPSGLPTAEQAGAQDTGAILVPVGIGAAAAGGALVAWDLANLFTTGTSTRVVSTDKRTRTTEERICDRAPAGGIALDLRSGDRSTRLTTDSAGKAQTSVANAPLKDWAFQRPFLTVAGTKVELTAEPAAKLAMEHRSEKELKLWLATFPNVGAPLRTEVEALLATTSEEARKLAEADAVKQAAELNKSARAAFQAGEFGDAANKASECLSLVPEHPQCKDIAARADREWEKLRQRKQAAEEKQARLEAAARSLGLRKSAITPSLVRMGFSPLESTETKYRHPKHNVVFVLFGAGDDLDAFEVWFHGGSATSAPEFTKSWLRLIAQTVFPNTALRNTVAQFLEPSFNRSNSTVQRVFGKVCVRVETPPPGPLGTYTLRHGPAGECGQ
jgi:hypothetical protein